MKRVIALFLLVVAANQQALAQGFPMIPPGVFQWIGTNYEGPGNVNGILSQSGQVKDGGVLSGSETDASIVGGHIGDADCDSQYCGDLSAATVAQLNARHEVAVNAPLKGFADNMQAKRYQDLLSVAPGASATSVGGQALSPLAVAFSSWNNASAGVAASLDRAFNFSNQINIQRYLSEQNVDLAFASSGAAGQQLRVAYRACIARNVKAGKSYGAAQEACISDTAAIQNVTLSFGLATNSEDVKDEDRLSFKFLSSHPEATIEYKDKEGTHSAKIADRIQLVAPQFFMPQDKNAKYIRLTSMIFVPPLLGLANQSGGQNIAGAARQVMDVYRDWQRIFGDLAFQYSGNDITVDRIQPSFTYKAAVSNLFNSIKQANPDQYSGRPVGAFKQYEQFKTDYNYYLIWKLLTKFCRVSNGIEPDSSIASFWTPSDSASDKKHITKAEMQFLSTSSSLLDKTFVTNLFNYVNLGIDKPGTSYACDVIDPELEYTAPTDGSSLGRGETGLKQYYAMKDSDLSIVARARRIIAAVAWIITQDQINTTVIAAYSLLQGLTATDFESQAKRAGEAIINAQAKNYGKIENYVIYARSYEQIRNGLALEMQPSVNSAPGAGGK